MADVQIVSAKDVPAPSTYVIPKRAELVLKAVNAQFTDNGATGDWLPAVVILSDSGDVIARATDQAVLVAGGDDAEVSWFPGVKNAGAGFQGLPEKYASQPFAATGLASGAVYSARWTAGNISGPTPLQNSAFKDVFGVTSYDTYVTAVRVYAYVVKLEWAASFAGDRYVEVSVPVSTPSPQRYRVNGTPQGDVMVLAGLFEHGRNFNDLVTVNVAQFSGAPQDILTLELLMNAALPGP